MISPVAVRLITSLIISVVVGFLPLPSGAQAQTGETVHIAVAEWCPMVCAEGGKATNGYLLDVVSQAMQLRGYKVDFVLGLDSHAVRAMKGVTLQGTMIASHEAGQKTSDAIGSTRECFYTLSDFPWQFNGVESLQNVSLGISDDFTFEVAELDQYIDKNRRNHKRIDIAHGDHASTINFNKLIGQRFQVLAEDEAVMMMLIDKNQAADKIRQAGCAVKVLPVYIGFFNESPHSDEYVKALNAGLKQLASSGQFAALRQRYGLSELGVQH